ncbi:hypothetical protein TNCV_3855561 [Trichonephila clavipes]|nr:hypothetical protein TNCV_3855561 [Trichonephila clavipes]
MRPLGVEVHEQMSQSGGLSGARPTVFISPQASLVVIDLLKYNKMCLFWKNTFSALENTAPEAPIETPVQAHKSPESTSHIPKQTTQSPKLPPPIMLLITDDLRQHTKTLSEKMLALRIKTAGKYVKLYTDTH